MPCYSLAPINFSLAERATMVYIEIKKQLSRDQAWVIRPASQAPSLLSCTIYSLKTSCVTLVTKTRGCLSLVPLTKLNQIMKKQVYPYKNDWETPTPPQPIGRVAGNRCPSCGGLHWGLHHRNRSSRQHSVFTSCLSWLIFVQRSGRFILIVKRRPLDPPCPHCCHWDPQSFCLLVSAVLKPGP